MCRSVMIGFSQQQHAWGGSDSGLGRHCFHLVPDPCKWIMDKRVVETISSAGFLQGVPKRVTGAPIMSMFTCLSPLLELCDSRWLPALKL